MSSLFPVGKTITAALVGASRIAVLVAGTLALGAPVAAQTGRHVLLVINTASQDSVRIGEHYAKVRGVPQDQVLRISAPLADEVSPQEFAAIIERPIRQWLARQAALDRILYIVLTKGVPLRISGTPELSGTMASVDSELTLVYRRMTGRPVTTAGRIDNPYFLGTQSIDQAEPFSHERQDIFLVTRLDAFTADEAIAAIDRARAPVSRGRFVLDMKAAIAERGNRWLEGASKRLADAGYGDQVVLERTSDVVTGTSDVLGYYSWGSNDPAIRRRTFGFSFVPGAIAAMFVSTDARTFTAPPVEWSPGTWEDRKTYAAGSPQSLTGDLIREGVTGAAGHVAEPYLDAAIRPEILFSAYVAGFNLVEAFYLAMPYLSWQTVIVGDPLCTPFPRREVPAAALEPPIDADTGMPQFFAARRLEVARAAMRGSPDRALKLALRSEALLARDDREGAIAALEEATALDPGLSGAQQMLAQLYDAKGDLPKAIARYRLIVERSPNDVIALNNLAYRVATFEKKPGDALPIAERAYTLSGGLPLVVDTLGWVHYLNGNVEQALRYLIDASRRAPSVGEIRWHLAIVLGAGGRLEPAAKELKAALDLDKSLESRAETKALRDRLGSRAR
jgi:uncharacterized protein (TIGR03790 family)